MIVRGKTGSRASVQVLYHGQTGKGPGIIQTSFHTLVTIIHSLKMIERNRDSRSCF